MSDEGRRMPHWLREYLSVCLTVGGMTGIIVGCVILGYWISGGSLWVMIPTGIIAVHLALGFMFLIDKLLPPP